MVNQSRDMLFISHAVEDNEFTKWLALQLAKEGYGVWCDLTKLLGGENWVSEINNAFHRTKKFIFVLSKYSNKKENPLGELSIALDIKKEINEDFIIPIKIDDLAHKEMDFRLRNLQYVPFDTKGWAVGLDLLLDLLQREKVHKKDAFNPAAVNTWWHKYNLTNQIIEKKELLSSNRFDITSFPEKIYIYKSAEKLRMTHLIPYPMISVGEYVLTFADENPITFGIKCDLELLEKIQIDEFLQGKSRIIQDSAQAKRTLTWILNDALSKFLFSRGLRQYNLSNRKKCFYFNEEILPNEGRIEHTAMGSLNSRIKLWGTTLSEKWFWGIRGWIESSPDWHVNINYHILAGENNHTVRPAPKRVYFRWNNKTLKEKLRASMIHLAGDNDQIHIKIGQNQCLLIAKHPKMYLSPVTFTDPSELDDDNE